MPSFRPSQENIPWPYKPSGSWIAKAIVQNARELPRKSERADLARRGLIVTRKSRI